MKKKLCILILALILTSILPAHAERTYFFQLGDSTLWAPVEESYIEGQYEKEAGPIRVSRGIGIGWFKPSNAVEILEPIDFGEGLISMTVQVAAQYPETHFEENMPDALFEIRIDSHDGPIIATVKPVGTTSWEIMEEAEVTITEEGKAVKGEHTIYIVNQIGTPEEYLDGTIKGSSNFNEITIVTNAEEPTPTPSPEPTEEPTPSPTPNSTPTPTPIPDNDNDSSLLPYIIVGAIILIVIATVVVVVIKKKTKE